MKNLFPSYLTLLSLTVFSILFITACEKDELIEEQVPSEIRQLVLDGITHIAPNISQEEAQANYNDYKRRYESLTSEELIQYYEIRVEETANKFKDHDTPQIFIEEAKEMLNIMKNLNNISEETYSVSYNKLDNEQQDAVRRTAFPGLGQEEEIINDETESASTRCYSVNFNKCMRLVWSGNGAQFAAPQWVKSVPSDNTCDDTMYRVYGRYNILHALTIESYDVVYNIGWPADEAPGSRFVSAQLAQYPYGHISSWFGGLWDTWGMRETLREDTRASQLNSCEAPCNCN